MHLYGIRPGWLPAGKGFPLQPYHRWLLFAASVVVLCLVLALAASLANVLSPEQAYQGMRFTLAAYILILALLMLIPINWWMFKQERVLPMRCKHLAMIIGLGTYAWGAAVAVLLIPPFLITGGDMYSDLGTDLRVVVGGACIVVILVPHRWIVVAFLPTQWYRHLKVAALERKIGERVTIRREALKWHQAFRPQYVEMATYITVINILDNYRRIPADDQAGQVICRQIEALLPHNPDYDDLVKAMSQVTYE